MSSTMSLGKTYTYYLIDKTYKKVDEDRLEKDFNNEDNFSKNIFIIY